MHYLEWQGPAGAPTLLLLHGYLAHAHWWDFIAPWLATQYRVIAPDFGGMGDSGQRPEYSYPQFHAEIPAFIDALGIGGCIAIGHSFGGRALLHGCKARPELFVNAPSWWTRASARRRIRCAASMRNGDRRSSIQRCSTCCGVSCSNPWNPHPQCGHAPPGHRCPSGRKPGGWTWKFDENVTRLFQNRGGAGSIA